MFSICQPSWNRYKYPEINEFLDHLPRVVEAVSQIMIVHVCSLCLAVSLTSLLHADDLKSACAPAQFASPKNILDIFCPYCHRKSTIGK